MGGVVSGTSNSELVDNLCKEEYIVRPEVENVFRMVDRADYMIFQNGKRRRALDISLCSVLIAITYVYISGS